MRSWKLTWGRLVRRLRYPSASTKIAMTYAAVLAVVILIISVLTGVGIYYTLYHQAEVEMEISIRNTMERIEAGETLDEDFWKGDPILPGVVLRVTDVTGQVILENDAHYPSIERVERHLQKNPSFLFQPSMGIADFRNARICYEKRQIMYDGELYELHFFKTVTAEKRMLQAFLWVLFCINMVGFLIAILSGFFMSRRVLQPIRALIRMTKQIEVENMNARIPVASRHGDELAELAGTFNRMLDRLQAGFAQQQRFVSDASHELRTPVTVILGYSDLLSRWGREDSEILDEGISSIRSEAEGMQKLIEKLLFLARADQKRQVLHKERIELSELVADVMKKTKLIAEEHEVELKENDQGTVFGDPVVLRQMMRIFLENSRKYTPKGGKIWASSKCKDGAMVLMLADTGVGISEEHQSKVFERFYRVDSSRTKTEGGAGGSGLGLSIASWIAEQHGIKISMKSELGKGTQIFLTIPLAEEKENA